MTVFTVTFIHTKTLSMHPGGFWDPEVCNLTGITVLGITLPDSIKMKKKKLIHTKHKHIFPVKQIIS